MNSKIKSCPFCGSPAFLGNEYGPKDGYVLRYYYIQCTLCPGQCGYGSTEENAIKQWNEKSS